MEYHSVHLFLGEGVIGTLKHSADDMRAGQPYPAGGPLNK